MRIAAHAGLIVALTLLTQLGGIAWVVALLARRRLVAFVAAYAVLWVGAVWTAPAFGRVPLPCLGEGSLRMQSVLYCALNRRYADPELAEALADLAEATEARHPGTPTLVLDAGFPFVDGFPMLPHLSHRDGRAADLAFPYRVKDDYLPGRTRSPIGYFAFEDGPTDCPSRWLDLRWDLSWLQPLWPRWEPEPARMRTMLQLLADDPRIAKVLIEPHLEARFGVSSPKLRFQGCRAARHDDHIHVQL